MQQSVPAPRASSFAGSASSEMGVLANALTSTVNTLIENQNRIMSAVGGGASGIQALPNLPSLRIFRGAGAKDSADAPRSKTLAIADAPAQTAPTIAAGAASDGDEAVGGELAVRADEQKISAGELFDAPPPPKQRKVDGKSSGKEAMELVLGAMESRKAAAGLCPAPAAELPVRSAIRKKPAASAAAPAAASSVGKAVWHIERSRQQVQGRVGVKGSMGHKRFRFKDYGGLAGAVAAAEEWAAMLNKGGGLGAAE